MYETFGGLCLAERRTFRPSAMLGFEADTWLRALACGVWNALNQGLTGAPNTLRVAIHPNDLDLLLGQDLRKLLARGGTALSYRDINNR